MILDSAARGRLLEEYNANTDALERLELLRAMPLGEEERQARLRARQMELVRAYRAGLPKIPLARCPFSGEIHAPAFDNLGLDGPWWNYYRPQRPFEEPPGHWIAMTGAMKLVAPAESAPFLAIPGPAVPYLFTRLIEHPAVKAVLYSLPVGRHTAYAITYFADAWPAEVRMPNLWGTDHYTVHLADGQTGRYESYETPECRDFDLARWIEAGKLSWIAPGDATLTLKASTAGCPYLGLPGCRDEQRLERGIVEAGEPA